MAELDEAVQAKKIAAEIFVQKLEEFVVALADNVCPRDMRTISEDKQIRQNVSDSREEFLEACINHLNV